MSHYVKGNRIVWIGIVVMVGILAGSFTSVLAVSPSNVSLISKWTEVDDCTYQIHTDGTTVYAKNCDTGAITYSGTDASTVINSALSALGTTGGKVFVKTGVYTLTSTLNVHNGTTFEGELTNNGNLISAKPAMGTIFNISGTIIGIQSLDDKGVIFKNFFVNGQRGVNQTVATGIHNVKFDNCVVCYMDHVSSVNAKAAAFYIEDSSVTHLSYLDAKSSNEAGIYLFSTDDFQVTEANVGSNSGHGIWVRDSSWGGISQNYVYVNGDAISEHGIYLHNSHTVRVVDNRVNDNAGNGIIVHRSSGVQEPYGTRNMIANNHVIENGAAGDASAIRLLGSGAGFGADLNTVSDNIIIDRQSDKSHAYAIREETTADRNIITGNQADGCALPLNCIWTIGSNTIVSNNFGYGEIDTSCSYQIFTNGTTYMAQDCRTGAIDFVGQSAHTVFDNAVDADHGRVLVKKGTYNFTSGFSITKGIKLLGEGQKSTIFNFSPAGTFITVNGTSGADTEIAGIQFIGNNGGSAQTAISITSGTASNIDIHDLDIHFFAGSGSYAIQNSGAIFTHIYNNHFWNGFYGIYLTGAATTANIHHNYFSWGAGTTGKLLMINGTSTSVVVHSNLFEGGTNRVNIAANQANFHDNFFENNGGSETDLTVAGNDHRIHDNLFTGSVSISGSNHKIHHNKGFATENKGSATATTTSTVVTHGLGYTPDAGEVLVVFTENPSTNPLPMWITTNSTHFVLNLAVDPGASDLDFRWSIQRVN